MNIEEFNKETDANEQAGEEMLWFECRPFFIVLAVLAIIGAVAATIGNFIPTHP
jgi:hypothetical protein